MCSSDLFDNTIETDLAPPSLSSKDIYAMVEHLKVVFGKGKKGKGKKHSQTQTQSKPQRWRTNKYRGASEGEEGNAHLEEEIYILEVTLLEASLRSPLHRCVGQHNRDVAEHEGQNER